MFKKLLDGFVFGMGFAVAFVMVWAISFMYVLPHYYSSGIETSGTIIHTDEDNRARITKPPTIQTNNFAGSSGIYYQNFTRENAGVLASGDGEITGTVTADNKPVADFRLRLALNGSAFSEWSTTNSDGEYIVHVPYGKYRIDGYEIDFEKAQQLLPGKIDHPQTSHREGNFEVTSKNNGQGIDLVYVDPVIKHPTPKKFKLTDTISIDWAPYPNATQYMIQVYQSENKRARFSNNRLFDWSQRPVVSENKFTLNDYNVDLKPDKYYLVQILALDDNMNILSETSDRYEDHDFMITE